MKNKMLYAALIMLGSYSSDIRTGPIESKFEKNMPKPKVISHTVQPSIFAHQAELNLPANPHQAAIAQAQRMARVRKAMQEFGITPFFANPAHIDLNTYNNTMPFFR